MIRYLAIGMTTAVLATQSHAQMFGDLAPSFDACAETHRDTDRYFETMRATGWTVTEDRDAAIARISDSFLPVIGPSGLPWDDMMAIRADAGHTAALELVGDRDVFEQDSHLMVIAGYAKNTGIFRVDCWLVLPDDVLVDAVFESVDDQTLIPQIEMAAFAGPERPDGALTRIMAVQLNPDEPPDPPLAGRNGLYIQTIIPASADDPQETQDQ